jgi:hypothetical protein
MFHIPHINIENICIGLTMQISNLSTHDLHEIEDEAGGADQDLSWKQSKNI